MIFKNPKKYIIKNPIIAKNDKNENLKKNQKLTEYN